MFKFITTGANKWACYLWKTQKKKFKQCNTKTRGTKSVIFNSKNLSLQNYLNQVFLRIHRRVKHFFLDPISIQYSKRPINYVIPNSNLQAYTRLWSLCYTSVSVTSFLGVLISKCPSWALHTCNIYCICILQFKKL